MESSGLPGGMYSTMGPGMLGLEMSLHHHPQQNPQNPHQVQQQQQQPSQMVGYGHQTQQSVKQGYPFAPKPKPQQLTLSDEDDPGVAADDSAGDGKRKMSPWHRMKWTDSMVKLLIMVVFYIGDEAVSEGNDHGGKKKVGGGGGGGGGGGVLQKKGKWKSVSRAMMERGFFVSPQQCEDKFNDLNKRYKRVNDILGKGTACRVVENQILLDSMDHLSPKKKEEVKKLLNSKHLFFREMCAYHNSCGGGGGVSGGSHHSPEVVTAAEPSQQAQQHLQHQRCFHTSDTASIMPISGRGAENEGSKIASGGSPEDDEDDSEDENDEEDDEEEEEEEEDEEEEIGDGRCLRKRQRKGKMIVSPSSSMIQQLSWELTSVVEDGGKSAAEKGQWMKRRLMQLEEQRVGFQLEAFEIEKQRLKWVKFSGKKEREMERDKLKNERMRLENERMVLLLRQKELEMTDLQQLQQQQQLQLYSNKRTDPSSITG